MWVRITPTTLQWEVDLGDDDYRRKQSGRRRGYPRRPPTPPGIRFSSPGSVEDFHLQVTRLTTKFNQAGICITRHAWHTTKKGRVFFFTDPAFEKTLINLIYTEIGDCKA